MKTNAAILFSDFGPYHVARIDALAELLNAQGSSLFAYRYTETSSFYSWKSVAPANATVINLGGGDKPTVVKAIRMAIAFGKSLRKQKIKVAFIPSYAPFPNTFCAISAKIAGTRIVLMNDSWRLTERASFSGKLVKHILVRMYNSALVGGTPQKQYAIDYGMNPSKIFFGYDAIDTKYYETQSARWKNETADNLPVAGLPCRYFLSLGRFAAKKNLPTLIKAYASLLKRFPALDISLVLVGDGEEENSLKTLVNDLQVPMREGLTAATAPVPKAAIIFYPFQQIDITPMFFSRCEAFVLPSLHEEWGLVVNEAMACSSAVIVSENVGCVTDLIVNEVNGFQFDPASENQLETILEKFVTDPTLSKRLGTAGGHHIKNWGLERFAASGMDAIAAAGY